MSNSAWELVRVLSIYFAYLTRPIICSVMWNCSIARERLDILVLESQRDGRMCINILFFIHLSVQIVFARVDK